MAKKRIMVGLLYMVAIFSLTGCFLANAPAFPGRDAKKYLSELGVSTETIRSLVCSKELTDQEISMLLNTDNYNVLFLLGKNKHIPLKIQDQLSDNPDNFIRSGLAKNTNITEENIKKLFNDESHTVYCGLATNPALRKSELVDLHKKRHPGLVWFAMNPNCPEEIIHEIENSDKELAKRRLSITRQRKKQAGRIK